MHLYSYGNANYEHQPEQLTGVESLCLLNKDKVLWRPEQVDTASWQGDRRLMQNLVGGEWTKLGLETLNALGYQIPLPQGNFLLEYGSSTCVAWVREDLKIVAGTRLLPGAIGVITLSQGNGPLEKALDTWAQSVPVLQAVGVPEAKTVLFGLFNREKLMEPAFYFNLPSWGSLQKALVVLGFGEALSIARVCHEVVSQKIDPSWVDFVAVLRYVAAQVINQFLGQSYQVPIVVASVEQLFAISPLGALTGEEYVETLKQLINPFSWDRPVRAFNYFSPSCHKWYYVDSNGRCLWFERGKGGPVKKKYRLRYSKHTVAELFSKGVGLSGAGIYLAEALMGKLGHHVFLARNYSKGNVFGVLSSFFSNPTNKAHALPVGGFYFYGQGCNPKVSLDSLVFLEILLRNSNPTRVLEQVMESVPVPFSERERKVWLEISLTGEIKLR